ncbi:MAG: rhamnulokinase family protein [Lachnospiraceae bacterium]|nr:rhamnulokinase family protein [Lachnospiraceae bacterium]
MGKNLNLMAFDLGASNGRAMVGQFDGDTIRLSELHRFENGIVDILGVGYWDTTKLFFEMTKGLAAAKKADMKLDCFGIDTWGVDYGLLDKNGRLLGNVISYRNSVDADMEEAFKVVPQREIFDRTGIASCNYNTLFQLYARKRINDTALENADTFLMLPDLLGYFLTGEKRNEYTIATTSMMINYKTKDWDKELVSRFGISPDIFPQLDRAGQLRGKLYGALADELGMDPVNFAAVGCHDTASAVAAIPGEGSFAFCSSGTWSLFGVETPQAIVDDNVFTSNFANEGTVQGGCRPLKNIMGMWIIQECRRNWIKEGKNYSWNDIVELALQEKPLVSIIDPDYGEFFNPGNMPQRIRDYCKKTGQPVPENDGQIARCVYESLALKYRWALERLEEIKGMPIDTLNIVGGGIQNKFLNRCVADATERRVITGPIEGAAIGNCLMQAVALGELSGIEEVREVVRRSEKPDIYDPQPSEAWRDAYGRLLNLL